MELPTIALLSSGLVPVPPVMGGAVEEYVLQVTKHLRKLSISATVVDRLFTKFNGQSSEGLVKIRSIKMPNFIPKHDVFQEICFGLASSKEISKYDLVHVSTPWVGLSTLKKVNRNRSKFVYTCHNPLWPSEKIHWAEKIIRNTESRVMRQSNAVIALNETMKKVLHEKARVPLYKLHLIPNGVDTSFFMPFLDDSIVSEKYDLDGKRVILFVGRISSAKDVHVLLKAYKVLLEKRSYKDLKLCIVGPLSAKFSQGSSNTYAKMVIEMAKRMLPEKSYIFTGAVDKDELRRLFSRSYVFVLPSHAEAFGLVLLEAMASGCPAIGAAAGGIVDVIQENETGLFFKTGNFLELAEKLDVLLLDKSLRRRLSLTCRRVAEREYDWGKIAERLSKLYMEVLYC